MALGLSSRELLGSRMSLPFRLSQATLLVEFLRDLRFWLQLRLMDSSEG